MSLDSTTKSQGGTRAAGAESAVGDIHGDDGVMRMDRAFQKFAQRVATATGSSWAFALAAFTVVVWAISGPIFGFSETWQLVINTGTTIVTFLMVFLIQNSQNRDTKAVQLKLDELLRAVAQARTDLV